MRKISDRIYGISTLLSWFFISLASATQTEDRVEQWIRQSAIPFDDSTTTFGAMEKVFSQARVIALGEATHGQHEVFEIKRQLTMHLIRNHGIRIVAYEASASQMLKANEFVSGRNGDREKAMDGFGMLIWQIEENRALLDDLREWNRTASAQNQVRLIGFDAQDVEAAMSRLIELVGKNETAVSRIRELVPKTQKGIADLMAGNREKWDQVIPEIEELHKYLKQQSPLNPSDLDEYTLRVQEFLASLAMYSSPGGRDQAMAELLLKQLERTGPKARCIIWAHNGHIQKSPMAYLASDELAMGGHLAKQLGNSYYALGVAFGEGEFQANARAADGSWWFRRYRLSPAPEGSLEKYLGSAGHERFLLDLRQASDDRVVQTWLNNGHGQRWFGGYSVSDDCDALTRDASRLLQTTPIRDFDGLIYVAETVAARPLKPGKILTLDSK